MESVLFGVAWVEGFGKGGATGTDLGAGGLAALGVLSGFAEVEEVSLGVTGGLLFGTGEVLVEGVLFGSGNGGTLGTVFGEVVGGLGVLLGTPVGNGGKPGGKPPGGGAGGWFTGLGCTGGVGTAPGVVGTGESPGGSISSVLD